MKLIVSILLTIFVASMILPLAFAEEKFSQGYNDKIIKDYTKEQPKLGWNIYLFEKKFGTPAAITYLCILVFVAALIKRFAW